MLTIHQLQDGFFTGSRSARQRLTALYRLGIVDRFRPYRPTGSACYHYVLGETGAVIRGLERGAAPASVRRDSSAMQMAYSQRLDHLVVVNGFFMKLLASARRSEGRDELLEWWSERRCAKAMGGLVYPDGYGVWSSGGKTVEFCVEVDRGTETLSRLRAKLDGYRQLESTSGVRRWVLFAFPTPRREVEARRALSGTSLPIASVLIRDSPVAEVWLPLSEDRRRSLAELAQLRTHGERTM